MKHKSTATILVGLTGNLVARTKKEKDSIRRLRQKVVKSVLKAPEVAVQEGPFHSERIDTLSGGSLEERPLFKEMVSLAGKISRQRPKEDEPEHRVFRRSAPTISPQVPGSVPSWGAGGQAAHTEGPFLADNGLSYWFDFYLITRTLAVYLGNEPLPSVLVPVQISLFGRSRTTYRLVGKSIWIRSDLFAGAAPAGHFTGLRISGGTMALSEAGSRTDDRLDVPSGASIRLKLTLVQQDDPDPAPGDYGADARRSAIEMPGKAEFDVALNVLSVTSMERAAWDLYQDERRFDLDADQQPAYSETLKRILVPCRTEPDGIEIPRATLESPLVAMRGPGQAKRAAWSLPTAAIDINAPPAAAGSGGLGVLFETEMRFDWEGLDGGPVALNGTWFHLEPGIINLTAAKAGNALASERFDLWDNETTGFASEARLQFSDEFPLRYFCLSNGFEVIFTQADSEVLADRPVKVDGQPFEIEGKDTFFLYFASDPYQGILLFDPDILADKVLDEIAAGKDPTLFDSCAVALNNTLLTVTQPLSYYLAGELRDGRRLKNGKLFLLNGLYYLLPTLPDPYAANLGPFLRTQQSHGRPINDKLTVTYPIAYLLCEVGWPPAAPTEGLNAETAYSLLPLQPGAADRIGFQCGRNEAAGVAGHDTSADVPTADEGSSPDRLERYIFNLYDPDEYEVPWDNFLAVFGRDCYSLLDVSSNADLMGIAYSPVDRSQLLRKTHVPVESGREEQTAPVPYEIEGMDLKASGQFVKAFTVPHISWEPVINLSDIQDRPADPPQGFLGFPNDGGPTRLFNTSAKTVTLAPIPVTNFLIREFPKGAEAATFSLFTLPSGLEAIARIQPENHFQAGRARSEFAFNRPSFEPDLKGGIQLRATGAYNPQEDNRCFQGNTLQRSNLISSSPNRTSVLGESITRIFNIEFSPGLQNEFFKPRGVPLERIDFSGYGSSIFSNWLNDNATFAETSQARFDVLMGRTSYEAIQVRSVIYPWGVYLVRTSIQERKASGQTPLLDSGWVAESDGEFDFNFTVESSSFPNSFPTNYQPYYADFTGFNKVKNLRPYAFYTGVVKRISNVANIRETTDFPDFSWDRPAGKEVGEVYKNDLGRVIPVEGTTEVTKPWDVILTPVRFTANVHIDDVQEGEVNDSVVSKEVIGYVQISPPGTPIPTDALAQLLAERPEIGASVDCVVDIGRTDQLMRISRVEINNSLDATARKIFVGSAKGTPVLPKDGSWSLVVHNAQTDDVTPLGDDYGVPLIRGGEWLRSAADGSWSAAQAGEPLRLADPADLHGKNPGDVFNYAFLQNTGSQKTLFSQPSFDEGVKALRSSSQHFADAYHLLDSKGIFPNLSDIDAQLDLDAEEIAVSILKEGYRLVEKDAQGLPTATKKPLVNMELPSGPWYWVGSPGGEDVVRIYLRYSTSQVGTSLLNFDLDSAAKDWVSQMSDTSIVVDLGGIDELFVVRGNFDSKKGSPVSVDKPVLEVGPDLKPIYDVLVLLWQISQAPNGDYDDLLEAGLEVAMSNTPETWDYKFSAEKEIPLIEFPPPSLRTATDPLRLEASLKLGAYFNMDSPVSADANQLVPSAGAYVEFYGQLSVLCVSLAAAAVYAVGQTEVRIYGDLKSGPGIAVRQGFGVEVAAGLPVIGTVSLLYAVGIEMNLNNALIEVGAFLRFKGRAEILGGIVTVTICIEARGSISRVDPLTPPTTLEAQVTFGLDISIAFVIDLSFEESWVETREIG